MRISLLGPGAMGLLFGGYLSRKHEVTLIGTKPENMKMIEEKGITITETDGTEHVFHPNASADAENLPPADLVLIFVKASATEAALEKNKNLIGADTILMTLQNGAGHEKIMQKFTAAENICLGTTQQGSMRLSPCSIRHTGLGTTDIGAVYGDASRFSYVADTFTSCGLTCQISDQVKAMVWNKLMINASSSVLSGVLQMPQGYILTNPYAWELAGKMITEICATAAAQGYSFDPAEQIERLRKHLENAPDGMPSITVDLKNNRKTEVDVITGAVVDAAHSLHVPVPVNEMILSLVHAMEGRRK